MQKHKKLFHEILSIILMVAIVSGTFFYNPQKAQAATYTFTQSSWAGGATSNNAIHSTNQTGWTQFSTSTSGILTPTSPNTNIQLASSIYSFTDDGATSTTSNSATGGGFSNGTNSTTTVNGSGSAASIILSSSTVYATSGIFTSAIIDFGQLVDFSTSSFNQTISNGAIGKTWGLNTYGQLGNGTTASSTTPVSVSGITNAVAIAGKQDHSLALLSDGTMKAWGNNTYGQLGNGTTASSTTPVSVSGITNAVAIAIGQEHSLALLSDGTIKAWGVNGYGQLGDGTITTRTTPVSVSGITNAVAIAGGQWYSLALLSDGTIKAWGYNNNGQLGDDTTTVRYTPVSVSGITNAVAIVAGSSHSLALLSDGTMKAWGRNDYGQLGNGTTVSSSTTPVSVSGITNAVAIAGGYYFSLALLSDGTMKAWGRNAYGQLGDGTITTRTTPVSVSGITNAVAITSGEEHSLALLSDGTMKAWGRNAYGQLGDGTITTRTTPVSVSGITNAVAIASGWNYSLAIEGGLRFQVAANTDNATWDYKPLPRQAGVASNRLVIPADLDGSRYFRYKTYLSTSDTAFTLSLDNFIVNYSQYSTAGELTSSPYDTNDATNVLSKIQWSESLATSTDIKFQVRTSSDGSSWSGWCGPDDGVSGSCSSSTYFTDPSGGETVDNILRDGSNDRWIQYKAFLTSGGNFTPTLSSVILTYVVNAPPDFDSNFGTNGASVSQNSSETDYDSDGVSDIGKALLIYSIRDSDTNSGTINPGKIQPSFEYRLSSGAAWTAIATSSLNTGAYSLKDVSQTSYTSTSTTTNASTTTALWNAANQLGANTFSTTTQIKVTVNDNEAANNSASSTSAVFTLDTKTPSSSITIDSSGASNSIAFNFSDDSNIEYRLSNNSDFSDDGNAKYSWQAVGATSTTASTAWTLTGSPSYEKVYFRVKDIYGNITATSSDTAPNTPQNLYYKDISNTATGDYKEFLSWELYSATTSAAFGSYQVYRSTDGSSYSQLTSITDSAQNYYTDTSVSSSTTYYYKVRFVDSDNDISNFTAAVSDIPNGQGGTDATAPTISSVATSTVQATWAKITWTTDEVSSSTIEYSTQSAGDYASSTTVASMVTAHEVTITGLTPNTNYIYRVKSTDVSGNTATASSYSFTTSGGPVISSVSCSNTTDNSASIIWNTNIDSNSVVDYSTYSNLASYSAASAGMVGTSTGGYYQHQISLGSLTQNTTYYFRVKSTDSSSNTSIDDNSGSFYQCRTTRDTKAPTISSISTPVITDTSVVIIWTTDESASSQVEYGTISRASGSYSSITTLDSTMTVAHVVTLTGLTKETKYYYRVKSSDANSNNAVSDEQTLTTVADRTVIIQNVSFAGGGVAPAPTDITAPLISGISVDSIGAFNATVSFKTNEDSIAFVEYGDGVVYRYTEGSSNFATSHSVRLDKLKMGTDYHFRIKAIDKTGNASYSEDNKFTTQYFTTASLKDLVTLENAAQFQEAVDDAIESILPNILPPFVEKPEVLNITENSAIIRWKTNVPAYSVVSYAAEKDYDISKIDSYISETSNITENKSKNHEIIISGLTSNTKYHLMAKSFVLPQAIGKSSDIIFTTKAAKITPKIADVNKDSIRVVWITDELASSIVEYKNMRTGEINRKTIEIETRDHDVIIENLNPDNSYQIKVMGYTEQGNLIEAGELITARTSKDTVAPTITNLKIEGTLVPGRNDRVQLVVSWKTNEPSNSIVEYDENIQTKEKLAEIIEDANTFTENHTIIITKLKPGALYKMRVVSVDDAGNQAASPIRTIITPRQAESIVDVIVKNFEETFKFLQKVR